MLAETASAPFDDPDFVFEIKWDGYRAIAELQEPKQPLFYSRNGINYLQKFKTIVWDFEAQNHRMVLDGEIVAVDAQGLPDFQALMQIDDLPQTPLTYQVFDLLWLNGISTESLSLTERKELLKEALVETSTIRYCDHIPEKGIALFKEIAKMGLEGIMAKRKDSVYRRDSRSEDWLKVRHLQETEAYICGFTEPRGSRKKFGALVLGQYQKGQLIYVGHTGSGFSDAMLEEMFQQMDVHTIPDCPFVKIPKTNMPATWLNPELRVKIHYTEKTKGGILRHPIFKGLVQNDDERPSHHSVHDKKNIPMPQKFKLTHLDKIFWPEEGITKGALIDYYLSVAEYILPYLKYRPLTLVRYPNGITGLHFYQKDAADETPEWVQTVPIYSESNDKEIHYFVCNNQETLAYLVNLGCIDFNPWNSRIQQLEYPDWLVIDLDPSEKNSFDQVIETALAAQEVCRAIEAEAFVKTSGSTGLHVYLPLGAQYTHEQARDFAHLLMEQIHRSLPEITTLERNLKKRGKDRIYLDYLQNRFGQTLACPYSVRPKPGAPVSTPLEWKELKYGMRIEEYNIHNTPERLRKKGDLFLPVMEKGIDMLTSLELLKTL